MPTPDPSPSPEIIEAAAAAWLSLRDRGMDAAEATAFMQWLQQDPQHAAMFAELDSTWKDLDRLASVPATNAEAPEPSYDLLKPRVRPRRQGTLTWAALGAAAAALVLLIGSHNHSPRYTAETAVGAFQILDLPDGSVAQLNTDSAIDITFDPLERRVRLIRGEVYFSVAKDPARPFIVSAGPVLVSAIGTAFNVRQRDSAIEVIVTEGRVSVDSSQHEGKILTPLTPVHKTPHLVAGESAKVTVPTRAYAATPGSATVTSVSAIEVQRALAWQERRLEFDAVPLADVVREFNRYNRRQLVITDPHLSAKRFSGMFRADGYESLVRLLEEDFGVAVTRNQREIVLNAGP